jgi:membrane protease YdiL (CAAX protease family)
LENQLGFRRAEFIIATRVGDHCARRRLLDDCVSTFVHRDAGLKPKQPSLAGGVGLNGFEAGALEELVFRGLILSLLISADSDSQRLGNLWRAILVSSLLFSAPHALNIFAGHAEARVVAQLVWAFLLGIVFACLRIVGRCIWPVAVLHGAMNAFVHVNRIGIEIQPSLLRATALALAPIPLCIYAAILLHKQQRVAVS